MRLRDLGNTVLVVEHDEETIRVADHVVDIGPGAGEHGGDVVYSGPVKGLLRHEGVDHRPVPVGQARRSRCPRMRRQPGDGLARRARRPRAQPQGHRRRASRSAASSPSPACRARASRRWSTTSCCRSLMQQIYKSKAPPGPAHAPSRASSCLDKVIDIDQSPIGRTPRSNPATYTGVFDHIRKLFAQTQEAKVRGYLPGPVLVQRERRPLRGLRRRRHDQDRDALPARRLRAVRGVQGRPLQPRHARHHVQGQEHRRGARPVRARRRSSSSPTSRPSPATCRRSSTSASATCGSASRRPRCRAARPSG